MQEEAVPELLLEQSTLEMLLTGTDTSSVTAYYGLLGLSSDEQLQNELREELQSVSAPGKEAFSTAKEHHQRDARFKPVRPSGTARRSRCGPQSSNSSSQTQCTVLIHLTPEGT